MTMLAPGSTIGIVGGGQLGRMLALAAARLGYRAHIFTPPTEGCARAVSAHATLAAFDDRDALLRFAACVDVVTFEFENIDTEPLGVIEGKVPIWPPLSALRTGQDRIAEKSFAAANGGRTAAWHPVTTIDDLDAAIAAVGTPAILKSARWGYDGKGQARIATPADAAAAWHAIGEQPAIAEAFVRFEHEFSIIAVRDAGGAILFWDAPENCHRDGVLAISTVPACAAVRDHVPAARAFVRRLADRMGYVGVLAVEFFATREGPVFNEMAPRVHNSGHWTIEGAVTCQFENHIRAIAGLPLGSTRLVADAARMENLIGDRVNEWPRILAEPDAHLHLYDKGEARAGRKMGHVTWVGSAAERAGSIA